MDKLRVNKYKRILLLLDVAAFSLSYLLAQYLRHHLTFKKKWMGPLYELIFLSELLLCVLLDIYLGYKRSYKAVTRLDPFQNLVVVIQNQIILGAALLVILMINRNTYYMSRVFFAYNMVFWCIFSYTFRMLFRAYYLRVRSQLIISKPLVVAARPSDLPLAKSRLELDLPESYRLAGIFELGSPERLMDYVNSLPDCNDVFLYLPENDPERDDFLQKLTNSGVNVHLTFPVSGYTPTGSSIGTIGYYHPLYYSSMSSRMNVLGVDFAVTNISHAVLYVVRNIDRLKGRFICFSNVHTTVLASEDSEYRNIQNSAVFTFPDGDPICKQLQKKGFPEAERVAGPDFMDAVFRMTMNGKVSHFFYGSTPETIELLQKKLPERFPGIEIKGMYSPPFRELTPEEDEDVIRMINDSGADLVWIGLGAPKQERFMAAHAGKINGLMLGVGAGFNFHAGNIKRAPFWIQRIGMEWLYRLFQDPARLFRRYFVSNLKYMWKIVFYR